VPATDTGGVHRRLSRLTTQQRLGALLLAAGLLALGVLRALG
jgi:hypothetical protein